MTQFALYLAFEVLKKEILRAVVKEFISRGLDKVYAKEIQEWKVYLDQQKFAIKLDKQMMEEIKRFRGTIKSWSPTELKEFVIEGLDCLKKE